jgi:hypothetical protein
MSDFKDCWEKDILIQQEEHSVFTEAKVFQALKLALTSETYLQANFLKLTSDKNIDLTHFRSKGFLLSRSADILQTQSTQELCTLLKQILKVDKIGIYAKCLFAFFENSIVEIGLFVEQKLGSSFKVPGSNLDLDIFFGDYSRSFGGIHRDGANLTFIFSNKQMLFWDFEVLEDDANKLSKGTNFGSAKNSGSFFFPEEFQDSLFKRIEKDARKLNLNKGDLIYWPTHKWHVAINQSDEVNLTLNIAMYKSDKKQVIDSLLFGLTQLDNDPLSSHLFFDMNSFLEPKSNEVFAEEQFAHLVSNVNKMKADFVKTRSLLLGKHLSSFGIESQALKLYRFVRTIPPVENLESIKIFKPALFKIFYTVENETVVRCNFFDDIINLIYHPSVITLIDYCNNTNKFSLQELLDQNSEPDNKVLLRNIHGLFRFLALSPGILATTKTETKIMLA